MKCSECNKELTLSPEEQIFHSFFQNVRRVCDSCAKILLAVRDNEMKPIPVEA